jgi:hypothetical protein
MKLHNVTRIRNRNRMNSLDYLLLHYIDYTAVGYCTTLARVRLSWKLREWDALLSLCLIILSSIGYSILCRRRASLSSLIVLMYYCISFTFPMRVKYVLYQTIGTGL